MTPHSYPLRSSNPQIFIINKRGNIIIQPPIRMHFRVVRHQRVMYSLKLLHAFMGSPSSVSSACDVLTQTPCVHVQGRPGLPSSACDIATSSPSAHVLGSLYNLGAPSSLSLSLALGEAASFPLSLFLSPSLFLYTIFPRPVCTFPL